MYKTDLTKVTPDDAIIECPSLVAPLLLTKLKSWHKKAPVLIKHLDDASTNTSLNQTTSDLEKVQAINCTSASSLFTSETTSTIETLPRISTSNQKTAAEYVRAATLASLKNPYGPTSTVLSVLDYSKTSSAQLLLGIGLSRVMEWNLRAEISNLKRKTPPHQLSTVEPLISQKTQLLEDTREANKPFVPSGNVDRCNRCPFKSEFTIVIEDHLKYPHRNHKREYLCNWCDVKTRDSKQILYHCLVEHNRLCQIEPSSLTYSCIYCPIESKSKRKMESHVARCAHFFANRQVLGPQDYGENDYPGITSRMITQDDVKIYEQTIKSMKHPKVIKFSKSQLTAVAKKSSTSAPKQNYCNNIGRLNTITSAAHKQTLCQVGNNQDLVPSRFKAATYAIQNNSQANRNGSNKGQVQPDDHPADVRHTTGETLNLIMPSIIINKPPQASSVLKGPDGSIVPNPKEKYSPISCTKSNSYVICEICDAYVKDLNQLKTHMQWIHNVKIHPRMLESRPPLHCQKCKWRFFTDQGLERHLLGAHNLITSNMQDQVDKGTDSGRCTVCGRGFTTNLVKHMREFHKANLKPAHLSYKCTVCSAAFNLYRLFENHVYTVHSVKGKETIVVELAK